MDVYYSSSFRHHKNTLPLKPIAIGKTFFWEDLNIFLPAVYAGEEGVVLDLCIRISPEKINRFLEKWGHVECVSELTEEEEELIEQENPTVFDFQTEAEWDNDILISQNMISIGWNPLEPKREAVSQKARELMEAYCCDPASGWQFVRCMYRWPDQARTSLAGLKLHFHERPAGITCGYLSTDEGCSGQQLTLRHPVTQKEHALTIHRYEAAVLNHRILPDQNGLVYPSHYRLLDYSIFPELSSDQFRLLDREKSAQPRSKNDPPNASGRSAAAACGGPIAFFIAGKSEDPGHLTDMSSLHFEPVRKVNWRAVFQVQRRPDMEITLLPGE